MTRQMFTRANYLRSSTLAPVCAITLTLVLPCPASAQTRPIPIHTIASPVLSTERFVGQPLVRHLPDGHVLVQDQTGKRLIVFDSTLSKFTISADSISTGGVLYPYSPLRLPLVPYLGDSTLFTDFTAQTYLLIDPAGRIARAMAPPRADDMLNLIYPGNPGIDAKGRLIYRASPPPASAASANPTSARPPQSVAAASATATRDTFAIVRADFDTRTVDTIASITLPRIPTTQLTEGTGGKPAGTLRVNPMPQGPDDWAVLSDGTLAIARAHDYHVDFVGADGAKFSGAKLPFDWKRLTDDDKLARIDSMKKVIDSVNAAGGSYGVVRRRTRTPDGRMNTDSVVPTLSFVSLGEIADYVPPIRTGAVKADADGNLWILPTTSSQVGPGLLYDVVNRKGELFERVRLPVNSVLLGFGKGGVVYFAQTAGAANTWVLGRGRVKR